jgi:hypothetical protein
VQVERLDLLYRACKALLHDYLAGVGAPCRRDGFVVRKDRGRGSLLQAHLIDVGAIIKRDGFL